LRAANISCQVLNASRAGNTINENLNNLRQWGGVWKPDVVVLYQMSMDVSALTKARRAALAQRDPRRSGAELRNGGGDEGKTNGRISLLDRLIESTTAYELLKYNLSARITQHAMLGTEMDAADADMLIQSVDRFVKAVQQLPALPVVCTFATSHDLSTLSQLPDDYALSALRHTPTLSMEGWTKTVHRLNQNLRRYAKRNAIPLIDVERSFRGHPHYFRDFVHFSAAGHTAMASELTHSLAPILKQTPVVSEDCDEF
jgi:hypothetical protein